MMTQETMGPGGTDNRSISRMEKTTTEEAMVEKEMAEKKGTRKKEEMGTIGKRAKKDVTIEEEEEEMILASPPAVTEESPLLHVLIPQNRNI